ncbi:hypothetical protein CEUSTIGMA_g8200.t1 [Chlamydomonas eustigma]|uniref:Peptidase S54 rhomboid domain-containing protein n=1 Tax=Chlamydomonas eustigma TaxID=1157962 RepID=A0A250XCE5_9CHLO|nr:hypothetical protein CEUSTIGMA_g8200.t1 [Chlamydomonas eustigma]|eukprot:GAX80765.1 hypothetical protein CEUSTIGMA_g8200.t1 [Chlamydomonas eustigma]
MLDSSRESLKDERDKNVASTSGKAPKQGAWGSPRPRQDAPARQVPMTSSSQGRFILNEDLFSEVQTSLTSVNSASGGFALPRHTPFASWVLLAACCIFSGTYSNVIATQGIEGGQDFLEGLIASCDLVIVQKQVWKLPLTLLMSLNPLQLISAAWGLITIGCEVEALSGPLALASIFLLSGAYGEVAHLLLQQYCNIPANALIDIDHSPLLSRAEVSQEGMSEALICPHPAMASALAGMSTALIALVKSSASAVKAAQNMRFAQDPPIEEQPARESSHRGLDSIDVESNFRERCASTDAASSLPSQHLIPLTKLSPSSSSESTTESSDSSSETLSRPIATRGDSYSSDIVTNNSQTTSSGTLKEEAQSSLISPSSSFKNPQISRLLLLGFASVAIAATACTSVPSAGSSLFQGAELHLYFPIPEQYGALGLSVMAGCATGYMLGSSMGPAYQVTREIQIPDGSMMIPQEAEEIVVVVDTRSDRAKFANLLVCSCALVSLVWFAPL